MQHRILFGSLAAVMLLGAVTAVVLQRGSPMVGGRSNPQAAAVAPGGAVSAASKPAEPNPAAPPPRPVSPSFDVVKVGPGGTTVIAGRAEPGSRVTIRDGDKIIGEVTADRRGEWVLVPEQPLGPGDRLLSLEAANQQGGAAVKSDQTVALSITPTTPGGTAETALAVVLPHDGTGAPKILQRPDESSPATGKPTALSVDTAEYGEDGRLVLSGRAKPGAKVRLSIGNEPVATATADENGGWTATANRPVGSGHVELRLDQLGEDGRVVLHATLPLARVAAGQLSPGQAYIVQRGNNLWQIARRTYGNGVRYLMIYSANLGQIRDPERIYPGQVFKLPKS